MFGPVPSKYRFIVWLCGLAVFAGIATWISPALPLPAASMVLAGLSLGVVAVLLFLHDFEHPQPTRARSRHRD